MKFDIIYGTLELTEQTVKELYLGLQEFKKELPERKVCRIKSNYCKLDFLVNVETIPNTQESLGFKADYLPATPKEFGMKEKEGKDEMP